MIKRIISLMLSFVIISSVFGFSSVAVSAEDDSPLYRQYKEELAEHNFPQKDYVYTVKAATEKRYSDNIVENDGDAYIPMKKSKKVVFSVDVEEAALYQIKLTYAPEKENENPLKIKFSLKLDGEYPFSEASALTLDYFWKDDGKIRKDGLGNEFAASQLLIKDWQTRPFYDYDGYELNGINCFFDKGKHKIELETISGSFLLREIVLCPPNDIKSYDEYIENLSDSNNYDGDEIILEAEDGAVKTSRSIVPRSDNTSAAVVPSNPYKTKINYIGGSNWSSLGDAISWEVDVKKSGLYKMGFHYRQNTVTDASVYRQLLVDGKMPFEEAKSIAFKYGLGWQNTGLSNGKDMRLVYLDEGRHTITLRVTLGNVSEICDSLKDVVYEISVIYRKLVMIVGDSPDNNRDYDLFEKIPDFEKDLKSIKERLSRLSKQYIEATGKKGSTVVSLITSMNAVIDRMLEYKYQAQKYKSNFYSSYASLSAGVYEMMNMPLDIDSLSLSAPDSDYEREASFFSSLGYTLKRFIASFAVDYNNISGSTQTDKNLTLWVNWGRDQAQVLNQLIRQDFTPNTDISVNVKITNASIIQAIISGNGPDLVLHLSRTEPINLAMRGALCDLNRFEDCDEILGRFVQGAEKPYIYKDKLYALPDTQNFYMMFIRTDIFEELGLNIPKTWDEFILASKIIMQNNMQAALPYAQIASAAQINSGAAALTIFPTLLLQNENSLYKKDLSGVDLYSTGAIDTFTYWTDFYTKYGFPKTYDFYNRFRTGLLPMAIQPYTMYAQLSTAAAEITGLWKMVEIPGVVKEDGTVSNIQAGGGTGCSILKISKDYESSWEFLKWWTSADTQADYSLELEAILGTVSRVATANCSAVSKLSWDEESLDSLMSQWNKVEEINEVPGGYYVSRGIDQAFWNVANSNANPKDILYEWNNTINAEIARKYDQYSVKE